LAALARCPDRLPEVLETAGNKWFNDAASIAEPGAFLARAEAVVAELKL